MNKRQRKKLKINRIKRHFFYREQGVIAELSTDIYFNNTAEMIMITTFPLGKDGLSSRRDFSIPPQTAIDVTITGLMHETKYKNLDYHCGGYLVIKLKKEISKLKALLKEGKHTFLAGFKAGIDAKSCCCNQCSRHSLALEEKVELNIWDEKELGMYTEEKNNG